MADSKICDMEASERSCSDKETVENVTITHGDELMNEQRTALKAVSRKRTEMTQLMCDENNLHFVKNELTALDGLCQQFQEAYNRHYEALSSPEDKEQAALHFGLKESDIFEYRKQVVDWIKFCEERLGENAFVTEIAEVTLVSTYIFFGKSTRKGKGR